MPLKYWGQKSIFLSWRNDNRLFFITAVLIIALTKALCVVSPVSQIILKLWKVPWKYKVKMMIEEADYWRNLLKKKKKVVTRTYAGEEIYRSNFQQCLSRLFFLRFSPMSSITYWDCSLGLHFLLCPAPSQLPSCPMDIVVTVLKCSLEKYALRIERSFLTLAFCILLYLYIVCPINSI